MTKSTLRATKPVPVETLKPGAILQIPTTEEACLILSGALGADAWADYRAHLGSLIAKACQSDRADVRALSGNLATVLAPVLAAAADGGAWSAGLQKAHGKKAAAELRNKALAKVKTFLNSKVQAEAACLFMLANWDAGKLAVFVGPGSSETLPAWAKAEGFQPAAYKSARAACIARVNAEYDNEQKAAAKAEAAKAASAKGAELVEATATALPTAAPTSTGKDSAPLMDALALVRACLKDGTADRVALAALQEFAADVSAYVSHRAADEAAMAMEAAAERASVEGSQRKAA